MHTLCVALAAGLFGCADPAHAAAPAATPDPGMSFTLGDLQAVSPPGERVTMSVLPKTRSFDSAHNAVGIVTIARNRDGAAAALFTVFDCGKHVFQIQMVGQVGNAGGDKLIIAGLAQASESDAAMSPTAASPWGEAAEKAACRASPPATNPEPLR